MALVQENLRQLLALAGTNPERAEIRTRLWRLYEQAAASSSPEVHRFAATIETWWPAIEASILTGYSNARSEAIQCRRRHMATTASPSTKAATRSGIATFGISGAPYAGPVLVNTDEHQQRSARCPVKFDEPP